MNPPAPTTRTATNRRVFLTAEWRSLAMLNYAVDPALLNPFLPHGSELDYWSGRTYVSVVGFLFLNTRVKGWAIPFHRNFEEVNLRFYVRRRGPEGWRRGVVFIRELVPRRAIAWIARAVYNENYSAVPMHHSITMAGPGGTESGEVTYGWRYQGSANTLRVTVQGAAQTLIAGSEPEFITEHYWGYAAQRDGGTMEYKVEHPPWEVWSAQSAELTGDFTAVYGREFAATIKEPPTSAFLAQGSAVQVYQGIRV